LITRLIRESAGSDRHHATIQLLYKNNIDSEEAYISLHRNSVGIGTLTPTHTLDVNGSLFVNGTNALLLAYPVGAIYISVVNTSPATLFGGTWVAFGVGQVLVGINTSDTIFDVVEETGGAKTSTPSAHTGTAVANHAAKNTGTPTGGTSGTPSGGGAINDHYHSVSAYTHTVTQPSAHGPMSIVQPYIVVYMWKRTA